ncbi:MAG: trypsin-like peptidase domain-containing protein [Thioalkalispiraceae bacterium]|jgi:serine protease DegS
MRITKTLSFVFQFATIGLAAAFLFLYLYPTLKSTNDIPEVVEFHESTRPALPAQSGPVSYAAAVESAAPAVVNIHTKKIVTERSSFFDDPFFREFFGDSFGVPRKRLETSLGSGVIISPQGYLLTNNHVIAGADEIQVALRDGRIDTAEIVGTDPDTDLAVLRIKLDKLPVMTLGHSENLHVGDVVLAIGNPFGVGQTVTSGIVSATGRSMLGISTFENFIQTDAAINPGNSGGALINALGELVGINTAIFSKSGGSHGIGFAIPLSLAKDVMTQIIQHGHVIRGWMGIALQDVNEKLAKSFNLDTTDAVIVTNVIRKGPADNAGLTRGDVITHISDKPVVSTHAALTLISQEQPGTTIEVKGVRNGKAKTWQVQVVQRPKQAISRIGN